MSLIDALPGGLFQALVLFALLLPFPALAIVLLRGFAPWPLVQSMLLRWRFSSGILVAALALALALVTGLLTLERSLREAVGTAGQRLDTIVTAPGSHAMALAGTVLLQPEALARLDGTSYGRIAGDARVQMAAPLVFGNHLGPYPVIGTSAGLVAMLSDAPLRGGRLFRQRNEAVIGVDVGLKRRDHFRLRPGAPQPGGPVRTAEAEDPRAFVVAGIMARTNTPWDRAILIPAETAWRLAGETDGHRHEKTAKASTDPVAVALNSPDPIGPPFDPALFPGAQALVVQANSPSEAASLRAELDPSAGAGRAASPEGAAQNGAQNKAQSSAMGMMAFTVPGALQALRASTALPRALILCVLALLVALIALCTLTGLHLMAGRFARQLGMLRALGAPRRYIIAVVWSGGATLMLIAAAAGLVAGHLAAEAIAYFITKHTGLMISNHFGWAELQFIAGFLGLSAIAALLPGVAALKQTVLLHFSV